MSICVEPSLSMEIEGREVFGTLQAITKKFCKKYHCFERFEDLLSYAWAAWKRYHKRYDTTNGAKYWTYVGKCVFGYLQNVFNQSQRRASKAKRSGVEVVAINPEMPVTRNETSESEIKALIADWMITLRGNKLELVRRTLEGQSAETIAQEMGIAISYVRILRSRAQRELRQWMTGTC